MKKPNRYKLNKLRKKLRVSKGEFVMLINVLKKVYVTRAGASTFAFEKSKKEDV